jgi:branched-chain amino acid transport system ATP-binding protein
MTQPSLLQITGLCKQFGAIRVTDEVTLSVRDQEIHALIGPNGAGKTTLINQIAGELRPDGGSIELLGQNMVSWSVAKRARAGISRSYQINSSIAAFTALENVILAVQAREGHNFHFFTPVLGNRRLVELAREQLEQVGMQDHQNTIAGHLAYGQQRLIEVAMALATKPRLLLLDEPMAGLGATETERMIELLDKLRGQCAMLLVEHDMEAVFALADRISVLVYGRVLLCDIPANVKSNPTVREAYLGDEDLL